MLGYGYFEKITKSTLSNAQWALSTNNKPNPFLLFTSPSSTFSLTWNYRTRDIYP